MKKEVSDALHFLLHCSLKDTRFTTQKEQFDIVYNEIERLNNIINALKQNELYCVDYETEEDLEKGNKIYIPFDLEKFIKELDKIVRNK